MAEEKETTGTEEEVLTGEGGEETPPTGEEGSQTGENTPQEGEGGEGEGEGGADEPMGYEIEYPDGRKEVLTAEQYNERLTNYPKLKDAFDRGQNELGELRKAKPTQQETQQAQQAVSDSGRVIEFTEDEIEDPGLRAKLNATVKENQELKQMVTQQKAELPKMINDAVEQGRMKAQIESAIENHPKLKNVDPALARITVENAIRYGIERNKILGNEVYKNPTDCLNAYFDGISGQSDGKKITATAVVRELRKDSGQVLVPGGSKTPVNVVEKFLSITDKNEQSKYLDSLSEEDRAKVEKEIIG